MKNTYLFYFYVVKQLLKTDFVELRDTIIDKTINASVWVCCTLLVMNYLMGPAMKWTAGSSFGMFMFIGGIGTAGFFEVYPRVCSLISDFEGDKSIMYYLTLPIPSKLVLVARVLYYAITAALMSLLTIPIGLLVIYKEMDISQLNMGKFAVIFLLANLFYGVFALWIASYAQSISKLGNFWMRLIFPLWMLGGYQFSWQTLHAKSTLLGYLQLFNPILYIMEGMRSAAIGHQNYLSFAMCCLALIIFISGLILHALARMKTRLDFV